MSAQEEVCTANQVKFIIFAGVLSLQLIKLTICLLYIYRHFLYVAQKRELELSTQIQEHRLETDVLKANIERKERVLESERAVLPSYHQSVLDSKLERMKLREEQLEAEAASLKWRKTSLNEEMMKTSEASQVGNLLHFSCFTYYEVHRIGLEGKP